MERRRIGGTGWQVVSEPGPVPTQSIELGSEPPPRRKRSRKPGRRTGSILLPLTVAIAMVLGGLAGRTLSETSSTLDKLQSVSTPPPRIADSTVRDESSASLGQPSERPDASPTLSGLPATTETASGGGEQLQTLPVLTVTATNPAGSIGTLPASTTTPAVVTAAGSTTTPPNGSEPSTTTPTDEIAPTPTPDGETLAEEQLAAGMTFDTAPAVAAIAQYQQQPAGGVDAENGDTAPSSSAGTAVPERNDSDGDDGDDGDDGGVFGSIRAAGSQLRDAAEGAAIAAGVADPNMEPLTILVMGVDARPGSAIDIGVRPDALMVLRLDPVAQTCKGLAIPRDSYVELPGYGMTKINHALMLGGIPYEQLVVEQYLGITIDHYALIDFTGFASLVDAVGGITIEVPPELASPAVEAGTQTITGEQALLHARYRGGPDGDFGRIKRQQQIMRGLIAAADGRDLLSEANRLLTSLQDHIRTDMDIEQLVSLATTYQEQCDFDGLQMDQIPGEVVYGPLIDPLFNLPLSYVVSDPRDVQTAVEDLLTP